MELKDKIEKLFEEQLSEWERASENYKKLREVVTLPIRWDNFTLKVQYNPCRIVSASAVVANIPTTAESCFLCEANRPAEQRGVNFVHNGEQYQFLINPFPIFRHHFTITTQEHKTQSIKGRVGTQLSLARKLDGYLVLFNGAKGGASCPGHMHFQAVPSHNLPLVEQFSNLNYKEIYSGKGAWLGLMEYHFNGLYIVRSSSIKEGERLVNKVLKEAATLSPLGDGGVNILTWYEAGEYRVAIFVRGAHRSSHFFREGAQRVIISMGAIDLAGVVITPLEVDFKRANLTLLKEIVSEIECGEEKCNQLTTRLITQLNERT